MLSTTTIPRQSEPDPAPRTVLLVEDNPVSVRLSQLVLETAGYVVHAVGDGQSALAYAERTTPDMVLQDIGLPDIDGFDLVQRLRALPGWDRLPIVAVTGYLSRVEEGRANEAGFSGYLPKPIDPARLVKTLDEVLRPSGRAQPGCLSGRDILVVDDNAAERKLLARRLTGLGAVVRAAADGEAALVEARARPPDLIVSNVLVARLDGFRLCAALSADTQLARIPVVLQTEHFTDAADRALGAKLGAAAYVDRREGFEPLRRAVLDALEAGPRAVPEAREPFPAAEYAERLVRQLERKAQTEARLSERCSSQSATLALLSSFAESLVRRGDLEGALQAVVAQGLDASGLSRGALFLSDEHGLTLRTCVGFDMRASAAGPAALFGAPQVLQAVMVAGEPFALSRSGDPRYAPLLEALGGSAALLLPLRQAGGAAGLFIMVSTRDDAIGQEWIAFGRILAAHLGQSLALARTFAEQARSERRLRALFEEANDGVFTVGTDGVVTDVNRRGLEILGRSHEQVVGTNFSEFAPASDRARQDAAFARTLARGRDRLVGLRVQRPDGGQRDIEVSAAVVRADQPELLALVEDVTEARELARCRDVEHAATAALASAKSWATALPDLLGRMARALDAACAYYWRSGHATGAYEVAATSAPSFPAPDLSGAVVAHYAAERAGRGEIGSEHLTPQVLALPIRCGDLPHGVITVHFAAARTLSPSLASTLTMVASRIGQYAMRYRSEELLRESEERFHRLTGALPHVFWMATPRLDRVLFVSRAFETIWKRTCQSLLQDPRSWLDAVIPEHRERALRAAMTPDDSTVEYTIERPDGTRRHVRDQMYIIRDELGEPLYRTGIAEDVTALRDLEARYLQSQKMEAFGQLAGGVAHDFNNLLSVIMGHTELMLEELRPDDPMRRDLEPVMRASKRAASLTRQLLAFARRQVMQPQRVDLNELIADVQKMLKRLIGEDIELAVAADPAKPAVRADPGQLEQVLLNLAINARDAMPKGGRLTIATALAPGGGHALLTVSDTGCGMSETVMARCFEPFYTTKGVGHGTGLGLATVMGIVTQSGGTIEVDSAPQQGARFTVRLPVASAGDAEPDPAGGPLRTAAPGARTVLIVEDEEDVANLAAAILKRRGYTVLAARDSEHALALARGYAGKIDLLLTDVVMPQACGPDVADGVRAIRKGTPVLFMSGYLDAVLDHHGIDPATVRVLHKPFSGDGLALAVEQAIAAAS